MKLLYKISIGVLILGVGVFAFIQINNSTFISKEHKQALIEQENAKSERNKVDKKSYDRYQDYLNTFIGTNVKEIETELAQESWNQEGNKFTSVNNDTITIETDEYDTITNVELRVYQITKIYNSQDIELQKAKDIEKQQAKAKAKREKVTGKTYDGMQGYCDSFIGMNVNELIKELEEGCWKNSSGILGKDKELSYTDNNDNYINIFYDTDTETIEKVVVK